MYTSHRNNTGGFFIFSPGEGQRTKEADHDNPPLSSLLSDSNQRPRDYKSRALAN